MNKKSLSVLSIALIIGLIGTYSFKKVRASGKAIAASPIALQSFIDGYEVGDEASDFNLRNIDGKMVSLSNYPSAKGFIIAFTCNHCPFSKAYEDRVIALNNKYAPQGYPVIAINPNDPAAYEEDSFENMKKRASEKGYTFPYLVDEKGIGQLYGAARTPHIFVLKKEAGKHIVKYTGAIDDSAQDPASVSKKYVQDAVDNLILNKPVVTQSTKAIGCSIKWRGDI